MRIVLVHGFNVEDGGERTIDQLAPHFEQAGHEVDTDQADYGFFSLWMVRFNKHSAVLRIAQAIEHADLVVAHSNGANYVNKALKLLDGIGKVKVVYLSPALNRTTPLPPAASRLCVFHTRTDFWVWVSGFLPFHPWGRMGQRGFKGTDKRVTNMDYSDAIKTHSGWFEKGPAKWIAKKVLVCAGL